jgi:hypothetical protein
VNRFYITLAALMLGWLGRSIVGSLADAAQLERWLQTLEDWARIGLVVLPAVGVGWLVAHLITTMKEGSESTDSSGEAS